MHSDKSLFGTIKYSFVEGTGNNDPGMPVRMAQTDTAPRYHELQTS